MGDGPLRPIPGVGAQIQHFAEHSFPAGSWAPYGTTGAASGSTVYTAGNIEADHFAFDDTIEEAIFIQWVLPQSYNGGVFRWNVNWDALATASGTVVWGLSGGAYGDSDAFTTVFGTERTITDTLLTVGDNHKSPNDGTGVTLAGTPLAGEKALFKLVAKTTGTIAVDVLGLNLQLQWQTKTTQPAVFA